MSAVAAASTGHRQPLQRPRVHLAVHRMSMHVVFSYRSLTIDDA
jgi:hypothetical protein